MSMAAVMGSWRRINAVSVSLGVVGSVPVFLCSTLGTTGLLPENVSAFAKMLVTSTVPLLLGHMADATRLLEIKEG
jgi:hypothetical protein